MASGSSDRSSYIRSLIGRGSGLSSQVNAYQRCRILVTRQAVNRRWLISRRGGNSNRRGLRQRDNPWPSMPIAARALNIPRCHANGRLRVARLNAQVQVDNSAAAVAVDGGPLINRPSLAHFVAGQSRPNEWPGITRLKRQFRLGLRRTTSRGWGCQNVISGKSPGVSAPTTSCGLSRLRKKRV